MCTTCLLKFALAVTYGDSYFISNLQMKNVSCCVWNTVRSYEYFKLYSFQIEFFIIYNILYIIAGWRWVICFTLQKSPCHALGSMTWGVHSHFGHCGKEKNPATKAKNASHSPSYYWLSYHGSFIWIWNLSKWKIKNNFVIFANLQF
jgi:hypothetical protein